MTKPRAYTKNEMRAKFLDHVWSLVEYWEKQPVSDGTMRRRMEGLAFSICSALDGGLVDLPMFRVVCSPHPDDKVYSKNQGENWVPTATDIGPLHDYFYLRDPKELKKGSAPC